MICMQWLERSSKISYYRKVALDYTMKLLNVHILAKMFWCTYNTKNVKTLFLETEDCTMQHLMIEHLVLKLWMGINMVINYKR